MDRSLTLSSDDMDYEGRQQLYDDNTVESGGWTDMFATARRLCECECKWVDDVTVVGVI